MTNVMEIPTPRKPRAFYAHLFMDSGALVKVQGTLYFVRDHDGAIIEVEPQHCMFLTVLGEVGLADTQRFLDIVVHQGYAAVACSREEGVR